MQKLKEKQNITKIEKVDPKELLIFKLCSEYGEFVTLWQKMKNEWNTQKEDYENLYRLRIPMTAVVFWCRYMMEGSYLQSKHFKQKNKYDEIKVKTLRDKNNSETFYKNVDQMGYPDTFRGRGEDFQSLYEVCNYLIHERESSYTDDMITYQNGSKQRKCQEETSFYYCVGTEHLRKRFNKGKEISYNVHYSNENDGIVFIDIDSFMHVVGLFLERYEN